MQPHRVLNESNEGLPVFFPQAGVRVHELRYGAYIGEGIEPGLH